MKTTFGTIAAVLALLWSNLVIANGTTCNLVEYIKSTNSTITTPISVYLHSNNGDFAAFPNLTNFSYLIFVNKGYGFEIKNNITGESSATSGRVVADGNIGVSDSSGNSVSVSCH